mmetsp:Transcript_74086/g.167877  ORF Transcript_74086/g.167877 Transcript_74086/m.167877 type:complete len:125 (+) Transcript_74086:104-478(+)
MPNLPPLSASRSGLSSRGSSSRTNSVPNLHSDRRAAEEVRMGQKPFKKPPQAIYKRSSTAIGAFYSGDQLPHDRLYPARSCGNGEFSHHLATTGFYRSNSLDTMVQPVFEKFARTRDWHNQLSC